MNDLLNIKDAVALLKTSIDNADNDLQRSLEGDDWADPSWSIETCYLKLLAIVESMGLTELYKLIFSEYTVVKDSKESFGVVEIFPDGEPHSKVCIKLRQYLYSIKQFFPTEDSTVITKDVLQIIRDIHYTITDKNLFVKVPQNEQDVHIRIEGILKCVFPDLKHEPVLTKQIKNFKPDTGIPSINTLIEYKFLSCPDDVKTVTDEVLADTRAYTSKDWSHFIYVLYETNRFRPEKEWIQLLKQSGVPENTKIVVLSGEPAKKHINKKLVSSGPKYAKG